MLQLPECTLILDTLKNNLPPFIDYHAVDHTLDVYNRVIAMAKSEGIMAHGRKLLGLAALYHDSGYMVESIGHEQVSCKIADDYLSRFGYSSADIETVCGIIMATHIPQNPKTILQKIICDADMDYLGRHDFFTLGERLYREVYQQGFVSDKSQWNLMQVKFLKQHRYFTKSAIALRQQQKMHNLTLLESKFELS